MARKCRNCKTEIPKIKECDNPYEKSGFCGINCMVSYGIIKAKENKEKSERRAIKARKEKLKTKGDHAKEAQLQFNRFIRLRDSHLPCISCGRHHSGQYHAGHYRTVGGHPELRFSELNCHKQCSVCNNHKSGNIVEYRINLKERIGLDMLCWLEGPHERRKYSIKDLMEIKEKYKKKAVHIKNKLDKNS